MIVRKIIMLLLFLFFIPSTVAETPTEYRNRIGNILPTDIESYTCFDYAINYSRNHCEYGCVGVSCVYDFRVRPHMINYKINDTVIIFHDDVNQVTAVCNLIDVINDNSTYYHFFSNESDCIRAFVYLRDNRAEFLTA